MELDFDSNKASGAGLFCGGLKFLDMRELNDAERGRIMEMVKSSSAPSSPGEPTPSLNLAGTLNVINHFPAKKEKPFPAPSPQAPTNTSYDITSTEPRTSAANTARQDARHARKEAVAAAVDRVLEFTKLPREAFPYSRRKLAETIKTGHLSLNLSTKHATILGNINVTPSMIESDLKNCNIVFSGGNPSSLRPLATLLTPRRS